MKKISVIIPCYNVEKYVCRCFESIEKQTCGMDRLEIIFVNDCSTDSTWEKLRIIEKNYPEQVILVECEKNSGPGTARNIGISYASGEYISFVDADDIVMPAMFEKMLEASEKHGSDVTECDYFVFPNDMNIVPDEEKGCMIDHYDLTSDEIQKRQLILDFLKTAVWGRLYRAQFISENELFFPNDTYAEEDVYFTGILMFYVKSYCKISCPLYGYNINSEGLDRSPYDRARHRAELIVIDHMLEEIDARALLSKSDQSYLNEFQFFCILKAYLDPVRKIMASEMTTEEKMAEASFFADHILQIFKNAADNIYFPSGDGGLYDLARHLLVMRSEISG